MGDTGGREWLLWPQKFSTRAFIRMRVGFCRAEDSFEGL